MDQTIRYQKLKILTNKQRYRIFKLVSKSDPNITMDDVARKLRMNVNDVAFHVSLMVDYHVLQNTKMGNIKLSVTPETKELIDSVAKGLPI